MCRKNVVDDRSVVFYRPVRQRVIQVVSPAARDAYYDAVAKSSSSRISVRNIFHPDAILAAFVNFSKADFRLKIKKTKRIAAPFRRTFYILSFFQFERIRYWIIYNTYTLVFFFRRSGSHTRVCAQLRMCVRAWRFSFYFGLCLFRPYKNVYTRAVTTAVDRSTRHTVLVIFVSKIVTEKTLEIRAHSCRLVAYTRIVGDESSSVIYIYIRSSSFQPDTWLSPLLRNMSARRIGKRRVVYIYTHIAH